MIVSVITDASLRGHNADGPVSGAWGAAVRPADRHDGAPLVTGSGALPGLALANTTAAELFAVYAGVRLAVQTHPEATHLRVRSDSADAVTQLDPWRTPRERDLPFCRAIRAAAGGRELRLEYATRKATRVAHDLAADYSGT